MTRHEGSDTRRLSTLMTLVIVLILGVSGCARDREKPSSSELPPVDSLSSPLVTVRSISVTPTVTRLPALTSERLRATALLSNRRTRNITRSATWTSSNPEVATVSERGNVIAIAPGVATIAATSGDVTGTARVIVTPTTLRSISITPAKRTIGIDGVIRYSAVGIFSDGSKHPLTSPRVTWSSLDSSVASIRPNGRVTGLARGVTTISATHEGSGISGTAALTVQGSSPLRRLEVTPPLVRAGAGGEQQFHATATFADGSVADLTDDVVWTSSVGAVADFEDPGDEPGLVSATTPGVTTITARDPVSNRTASTTFTVTAPALTRIEVSPNVASIRLGNTTTMTAFGVLDDGERTDLTTGVTWASSSPEVATVSNAVDSRGRVVPMAVGSTTISATDPATGLVGEATITVVPAALVTISLTPPNPTLAVGVTIALAATGTYSDGSTAIITEQLTWVSSSTTATVSNTAGEAGQVTAASVGEVVTITALDPATGVSGFTTVTIAPATLRAIQVTPNVASIALGRSLSFSASGVFSDGTTHGITTLSWSSSSAVAQIAGSGSTASAVAAAEGTTTITAIDWVTGVSGTAALTITPPDLVGIAITPSISTFPVGWPQPLVATGSFSNGTTRNISAELTWTASSDIAAVSAGDCSDVIVVGQSPGAVDIQALDPATGINALARVTLTPDFAATSILRLRLLDALGQPLLGHSNLRVSAGSVSAAPDCRGRFTMLVPTGSSNLSVWQFGRLLGTAMPNNFDFFGTLNVPADTTIDIPLPITTVRVHVTDPSNHGVPGAGVSLNLSPQPVSCGAGSPLTSCRINMLSSFHDLSGVPAQTDGQGDVSLYTASTTGGSGSIFVTPPATSDLIGTPATFTNPTSLINVTLAQGYRARLRILDVQGNVLGDPSQRLSVSSTSSFVRSADGYFEGLVAASSTVVIRKDGSASSALAIPYSFDIGGQLTVTGPTEADLTIPVKTITVHVVDPNGAPVSGSSIMLSGGGGGSVACGAGSILTSCFGSSTSIDDVTGARAVSDTNGDATLYAIPNATPHAMAIVQSSATFIGTQVSFNPSTTSTLTVTVQPQPTAYPIGLRVVDPLGGLISGSTLTVRAGAATLTRDAEGVHRGFVPTNAWLSIERLHGGGGVTDVAPESFALQGTMILTGSATLDLPIPTVTLTAHVLDPHGGPVLGATAYLHTQPAPLGCGVSFLTSCQGRSSTNRDASGAPAVTDVNGDVSMWMLPTQQSGTIYVTPPAGSDLVPGAASFNAATARSVTLSLL